MSRRIRIAASWVAALSLAFAQLAVSAVVCEREAVKPAQAAEGAPCHDVTVNPNLCERHCDYGASSVGTPAQAATPDVLALPLPWRAEPAPLIVPAPRMLAMRHGGQPLATPPPTILFGVLRI